MAQLPPNPFIKAEKQTHPVLSTEQKHIIISILAPYSEKDLIIGVLPEGPVYSIDIFESELLNNPEIMSGIGKSIGMAFYRWVKRYREDKTQSQENKND